jgi:hypothetical protein
VPQKRQLWTICAGAGREAGAQYEVLFAFYLTPLIGGEAIFSRNPWSMIRKSGSRFSEKIMLKQRDEIMIRFHLIGS